MPAPLVGVVERIEALSAVRTASDAQGQRDVTRRRKGE